MRVKGLQFPDYAKEHPGNGAAGAGDQEDTGCKRTGLSNSFFYRNEKIKEEVHKAVDIQNQSYKMNIDEAELLDEYKEKLLAMRIEIIKLKAENQKLESELDTLRRQQKGVSDVK